MRRYRRREPERGVLHRVLLALLQSLLARSRERDDRRGLPSFVLRELYRYLGCGLLAFGFARVRCAAYPPSPCRVSISPSRNSALA